MELIKDNREGAERLRFWCCWQWKDEHNGVCSFALYVGQESEHRSFLQDILCFYDRAAGVLKSKEKVYTLHSLFGINVETDMEGDI